MNERYARRLANRACDRAVIECRLHVFLMELWVRINREQELHLPPTGPAKCWAGMRTEDKTDSNDRRCQCIQTLRVNCAYTDGNGCSSSCPSLLAQIHHFMQQKHVEFLLIFLRLFRYYHYY